MLFRADCEPRLPAAHGLALLREENSIQPRRALIKNAVDKASSRERDDCHIDAVGLGCVKRTGST